MTELRYTDPETGEIVTLDITGWQLVINTEAGEVMRVDFPMLALMVKMRAPESGPFKHSLLRPDDTPALYEPPDWWLDLLVERR